MSRSEIARETGLDRKTVRKYLSAPGPATSQPFGGEVLATAILDRLLHHCEVISVNGPSHRLKNRLRVIERENEVA